MKMKLKCLTVLNEYKMEAMYQELVVFNTISVSDDVRAGY